METPEQVQSSTTTPAAAGSQHNNRADSTNHRKIADVMLASSEADGNKPIVTFCPYAGKPGRPRPENNHNKAVSHAILSGTVLWLVCPMVNNVIARIERTGGVKTIDARLKVDNFLGPLHEASHRVYENYVTQTLLKDPEEQQRFLKMFVLCQEGEATSKAGNWNRKYGNAGVSGPRDLKCFHAVAAQALGGAANPVGCVVVRYLFHLYAVLEQMREDERIAEAEGEVVADEAAASSSATVGEELAAEAKETASGTQEQPKPKPDPGAPSRRIYAAKKTPFTAYVDDFGNFETFLNECLAKNTLSLDDAMTARLPELTAMCKEVLVALEGHEPYHRKKRRIH